MINSIILIPVGVRCAAIVAVFFVRDRPGWKRDFLAAVREASGALEGLSEKQRADTIRTYRRERGTSGATVAAEVARRNAVGGDGTTRLIRGRGMNRPARARRRISEARAPPDD